MVSRSYRLDTVAAHLTERLEGARRSYLDRPDDLAAAARRIVDEALEEVVSEMNEVMADPAHAERLRHEMIETFLPRWLQVARLQNTLESGRLATWLQPNLAFRLGSFFLPLLFALGATRVLHSPVVALFFVVPFLLPLLPELRTGLDARRYHGALQEIVNDLERIQLQLDAYQPPLSFEDPGAASAAARTRRRQPDSP